MICRNLLNICENVKMWEGLRVHRECIAPQMGPIPLVDVFGYAVAVNMLTKSLQVGCYVEYMQFGMICKLRLAYANWYHTLLDGNTAVKYLGQYFCSLVITCCHTQSDGFEKFTLGCLKRIGQVVRSMEVALEFLVRLNLAAK